MKKTLYFTLFLTALATLYFFTFYQANTQKQSLTTSKPEQQRLPWHIQQLENNTTRVFNITLGETTFQQAGKALGMDKELAILIDQDDKPRLEMYYPRFKAGPITGKLIVMANINEDRLARLVEKIETGEYLTSGARKFIPHDTELDSVNDAPVKQLVLLPTVSLDEEIINKRFGPANEVIKIGELATYYIFPEKGLAIALYSEGKDVLQYVHPKDMKALVENLKREKAVIESATSKN
jgi:hypothetical protein